MTSLFKMIDPNFNPGATVENAGVRPSAEHVAVADYPQVLADFERLAAMRSPRKHLKKRNVSVGLGRWQLRLNLQRASV